MNGHRYYPTPIHVSHLRYQNLNKAFSPLTVFKKFSLCPVYLALWITTVIDLFLSSGRYMTSYFHSLPSTLDAEAAYPGYDSLDRTDIILFVF